MGYNSLMHLLNGKLLEEKDLVLPVRDLAILRGYGVFDFFVTYNNRPFRLEDRMDRLYNSAEAIDLEIPISKNEMKAWVLKAIDANPKLDEKMVKIVVTGGVSSNGFLPDGKPNIVIMVSPRHKPVAPEKYETGIKVIADKFKRDISKAKTTDYIEAVRRAKQMREVGADEILYFDDSQVYECSKSNIWALIEGKLVTPKTGVLLGITRKVLLEILKLAIPVSEEDFPLEQLLGAQEVFMSSSNGEIIPIVQVDDKTIDKGKVGEITKEVMKQFKDYVESGEW